MISTVIFDIGNVMMKWNWERRLRRYFDDATARAVSRAVLGNYNWNEMDRGVRTLSEVEQYAVKAAPDCAAEIRFTIGHLSEFAQRCDYAIPWIAQLKKKGYRVLYLSNYSYDLMRLRPDVLDFVPFTDGGIFSCNVRLTKPERAIYERLCSDWHVTPSEGLFIDDTQANVDAAKDYGLGACRFIDYETSYRPIMELLDKKGIPAE
ncbi:MAG: HAD family hydrolase [Pyramidobacter sp.]